MKPARVASIEQELRKAKNGAWLFGALALVIGAAIASPGEEARDAGW
jgi:hypothetical protein